MEKFSDFISEQKNEQPYKLVVFQNSNDWIRDVKDTSLGALSVLLKKSAKSAGIKLVYLQLIFLKVYRNLHHHLSN